MHYKKYEVHSPLFALRDPRLSAYVLALFSGARPQQPSFPAPEKKEQQQ